MTHGLLPKPVAGADDTVPGVATQLKEELVEDLVHCVVLFQLISSGARLGRSGICSIWGSLLLFWFRSQTLIVSVDVMLYSCIV